MQIIKSPLTPLFLRGEYAIYLSLSRRGEYAIYLPLSKRGIEGDLNHVVLKILDIHTLKLSDNLLRPIFPCSIEFFYIGFKAVFFNG